MKQGDKIHVRFPVLSFESREDFKEFGKVELLPSDVAEVVHDKYGKLLVMFIKDGRIFYTSVDMSNVKM